MIQENWKKLNIISYYQPDNYENIKSILISLNLRIFLRTGKSLFLVKDILRGIYKLDSHSGRWQIRVAIYRQRAKNFGFRRHSIQLFEVRGVVMFVVLSFQLLTWFFSLFHDRNPISKCQSNSEHSCYTFPTLDRKIVSLIQRKPFNELGKNVWTWPFVKVCLQCLTRLLNNIRAPNFSCIKWRTRSPYLL